MRRFALLVIAAGLACAGLVQLCSVAFYGDLAVPDALPRAVPPALGAALAGAARLAQGPVPVRAAYARALVHRGKLDAAAEIVATLPVGATAAELRGQIAEARGDRDAALAGFIAAGDVEHAQAIVDDIDRAGHVRAAIALEDRLIAALGNGLGHTEVLAVVLWRRGQLEQEAALAEPLSARRHERTSLAFYERALALAPREETYLLAAGMQALTLGERARARAYYQRALDVVPTSLDARNGLARSGSAPS